jgi:MoxR-like ATPase
MVNFARYYIDFIRDFFENIGKFFNAIIGAFADLFFNDVAVYFDKLVQASTLFDFLDWLIAILVLGINMVFIVFFALKIYQLLRVYIRFVKTEMDKDELLEEVALLTQKTVELADEKNKILMLKLGGASASSSLTGKEQEKQDKSTPQAIGPTRFAKLTQVDEAYRNVITSIQMTPEDTVGLPELVNRFINFSASRLNLYYNEKIIRTFFAGMASSKILILEGISGTGKTSLPYAMGKFFGHDSAIISVQPSWRDRAEMIGYLNEFTKKFNETDFLKELYETTYREDLNFIVLDELNLARIEYYFAEFLSIMEMPNESEWKIDVVSDRQPTDPKHFMDGKILVPQNVWFVGTANKDDSTFTITDKVYDRASSIIMNTKAEFVDAPYTENITMSYEYLKTLFDAAWKSHPISPKALDNLGKLDDFIAQKFKITFGNRIMKQIKLFTPIYVGCGGSEYEALDYMVARKILRKFEVLNLPFLQDELSELIVLLDKLFGKNVFKECIGFLTDLKKMN